MSETAADYNKFRIIRNHPEIGEGQLIAMHPSLVKVAGLVTFDLTADIVIEDYVEISTGVQIFTHRHHWRHSRELRAKCQRVTAKSLRICEDAFIGVNAIILGIERIGKGAVIGAGAVVTHDVLDFEIWAGNPARKIGVRGENENGGGE